MPQSDLTTEVVREFTERAVEAITESVSGNENVVVEASVAVGNNTVTFLIVVVVVFGVALLFVCCFCFVAYRVPG